MVRTGQGRLVRLCRCDRSRSSFGWLIDGRDEPWQPRTPGRRPRWQLGLGVAASPHHRDEENNDENQKDGSESDVHEFTPSSLSCGFRVRRRWHANGWGVSASTARRTCLAKPKRVDESAKPVIDYLPGGERIHLMRYQGPEQRSRESASDGRVQHGAGTPSVLALTVPRVLNRRMLILRFESPYNRVRGSFHDPERGRRSHANSR
jgi:hypothetical protein